MNHVVVGSVSLPDSIWGCVGIPGFDVVVISKFFNFDILVALFYTVRLKNNAMAATLFQESSS